MKRSRFLALGLAGIALAAVVAYAQNVRPQVSPYAEVLQRIYTTDVEITYHRPAAKGRTLWGDLVPYGKVWRAGANNNTTFECSKDITIEGKTLPAGKYGFHVIPTEESWTLAFNKVNNAWGSFSYDESEDALRVTVSPVEAEHQESLVYGFEDLAEASATCFLHWGELKAPFKIEAAK